MYFYYIINRINGFCQQKITSGVPNWSISNDMHYSIELDNDYNVLGKYYLGGKWYTKIWEKSKTEYYYDDAGNPIEGSAHDVPDESAGYIMEEFVPETEQ